MCSSASSTDDSVDGPNFGTRRVVGRHGCVQRALARLLATVLVLVLATPGGAKAGSEFESADQAVMWTEGSIDNSVAGETTIHSLVDQGETFWAGGLDQPANNVLIFDLASPTATHLNIVGGDFSAHLDGRVRSAHPDDQHTLVFSSPYGVFIGPNAMIDVGRLVAVGADLTDIDARESPLLELSGPVVNEGVIRATQDVLLYGSGVLNFGEIYSEAGQLLMLGGDAIHWLDAETITRGLLEPTSFSALLGQSVVLNAGRIAAQEATLAGRRVINQGHIRIEDGTLLMAAGDAVHLKRLDDPVLVRLPQAAPLESARGRGPDYAIDQQGTIDAGRGHVRLSATDALGWGIRQGDEGQPSLASIHAARIELEGGDQGRVELSGELVAQRSEGRLGGDVTVTGETIVLKDARVDASGAQGGGVVRIGGDQQGGGALQRARAVVMDSASEIHADGGETGDGGRVIVFSEDLTHLSGEISARGGDQAGDGGFIETSGLSIFHVAESPDASAPSGAGGEWLIDPYTINIVLEGEAPDCPAAGDSCLNKAVEQIIRPNFDNAGFDDFLRTVDPGTEGLNNLSAELLVRALSVGISVTLSTEAFDPNGNDPSELSGPGIGDINVLADVSIPNGTAAQGTRARLTLRAAGDVNILAPITVGDDDTSTPDMVLDIELRANDQLQRNPAEDFGEDQLLGTVEIGADIRTGGGALSATGIAVTQAAGTAIRTGGGAVRLGSGSRDRFDDPTIYERTDDAPLTRASTPGVFIEGDIDTRRLADDPGTGGAVTLSANAIGVRTSQPGDDLLDLFAGQLTVSGSISSGGGNIALTSGSQGLADVGNVTLDGATIDSSSVVLDDAGAPVRRVGGNVRIDANRVDADEDLGNLETVPADPSARGRGGYIDIGGNTSIRTRGGLLTIGSNRARSITIDGTLNTTRSPVPDDPTSDAVDADAAENGLVTIFAGDESAVDLSADPPRYGAGSISIGTRGATTILSAGIGLESRNVTLSDGVQSVTLRAAGQSSAGVDLADLGLDATFEDAAEFTPLGTVRIEAADRLRFSGNSSVRAQRIDVTAAPAPDQLNENETVDPLRLVFAGNETTGTLFQADEVAITIGDGATTSEDLSFDGELEALRSARGSYSGLRLRDETGAFRPESVSILQDGDLTVAAVQGVNTEDLYLGGQSGAGATDGAFGAAPIGAEGQTVTLESRDGTLTIRDAAGLNDDVAPDPNGDAGRSFVTLHGGLRLADAPGLEPSGSLVIETDAPGFDPFALSTLTLTSPRDLRITAAATSTDALPLEAAIAAVDELTVIAGRAVDLDLNGDGDLLGGTLSIESGVELRANDRLELHGAARGFGDLVFESGSPTATKLRANEIALWAGGAGDSEETDAADYAQILGANEIEYRRADDGDFLNGTSAESFSFQQDAAIDAQLALPSLQRFVAGPAPTTFGGPADAIAYALRSDYGAIDLTGLSPTEFINTRLSLIGRQNDTAALLIDEGFVWDGPELELGGVGRFNFTQALSDAFTPAGAPTSSTTRVRLRAGLIDVGTLQIESGVTVRAPIIELVASDGFGGKDGSRIAAGSGVFDLGDAAALGVDRIFVYHEDETLSLSEIPDAARFTNGLPTVIGLRDDSGLLSLTNPDFTSLPFDLSAPARLILEARAIQLVANGRRDLQLTGGSAELDNLRLRLRADTIDLRATGGREGATDNGGVLAGERGFVPTSTLGPGTDADFDAPSLILEGTDLDAEFLVTTNLSELSRDTDDPALFDLQDGLGPSTIYIEQDADMDSSELPIRWHVAGELSASTATDLLDEARPTTMILDSNFGDVSITANTVGGSHLELGRSIDPIYGDLTLAAATGGFVVDDLLAFVEGSIRVEAGADLSASDSDGLIQLEAAALFSDPSDAIDATNPMGNLIFEGTDATSIVANRVVLRAGPVEELRNPFDRDRDGERDEIIEGLARIDFTGLSRLDRLDETRGASLTVSQAGAFDTSALSRTLGGTEWDGVELASIESALRVSDLQRLGSAARSLRLSALSLQDDSLVQITREQGNPNADILSVDAGFQGTVQIESNDIRFVATGTPQLRLDSPNLRVFSDTFQTDLDTLSELGRVNSDIDVLERLQISLLQDGDFASTRLIRPDRYSRRLFSFFTNSFTNLPRDSLARVAIELTTRDDRFVYNDGLRDDTRDANVTIATTSLAPTDKELIFDIEELPASVGDYAFQSSPDAQPTDFAAVSLSSLESLGFDQITIAPFTPGLPDGSTPDLDLTFETAGDQIWDGAVALQTGLSTNGRDIRFTGDVYTDTTAAPNHFDLLVETRGDVRFEGQLGDREISPGVLANDPAARLSSLWVIFDEDAVDATPVVQFGQRTNADGDEDGVREEPVQTNQFVRVEEDVVFVSTPINEPDNPLDLEDGDRIDLLQQAIENAADLDAVAAALTNYRAGPTPPGLSNFSVERDRPSPYATVGKADGNLTFESANGGHFVMGSGERLSVGGHLRIEHPGGVVTLGDVAAIGERQGTPGGQVGILIEASEIGLVRRNAGLTRQPDGSSAEDSGSAVLANSFDFGVAPIRRVGRGKNVLFGVPDPYDGSLPSFLDDLTVAANRPNDGSLVLSDFSFNGGDREQVAIPVPTGASRSDLSGAFGPLEEAHEQPMPRAQPPVIDPSRLAELDLNALETPARILRAQLTGGAVIDDLSTSRPWDDELVSVTSARLDADDAELAIALHHSLFGAEGERAGEVRSVLQDALDRYLETTRARRVIGFELRRFVKNRPSTLLDAYATLDQLDALFRYHRRLGLSPGEYRQIQARWLASIQPQGITLDELSEAIHPSRYVRGSDILDIFGR